MHTVLFVVFNKDLDGKVIYKNALVRLFNTEKEAKEALNDLYLIFHFKGDRGYKFLKEFRIISKRSFGMSISYGRVDYASVETNY